MKQEKMHKYFMEVAKITSELSNAKRKKVGAVLVKNGNIISFGWNGMPSGFPNECEDDKNNTLKEVVHAEFNIISKIAKSSMNCEGADLYITLSPCFECSKLLIQSRLNRIFYLEKYRDETPIDFLEKAGIECYLFEDYIQFLESMGDNDEK